MWLVAFVCIIHDPNFHSFLFFGIGISSVCLFFFFKQKTAYEMRISDWSSDVCSSDLGTFLIVHQAMRHSGPLFFVGLRFGTAALIALPLAWPVLRGVTQREWLAGTMIGVGIFTGYTLQTWGLRTIPSSPFPFITPDLIRRTSCRERVCQFV